MDTCRFNMFHHTHYMEILAIKNGIDLSFLATVKEMINQDFITGQMFQQTHYCFFQFFIIDHNPHPLSAQYIRRPYQNRVTHFFSHFNGFINIISRAIIRIRNIQFFQHIAETAAVFGNIHIVVMKCQ